MRTCLRCVGVLVVVLVLAAAGVYWFVSTRGVSARDKPLALEAFIARHLRRLALPAGARTMTNPLTLSPPEMADARDHFANQCALCHNNNGDGNTMINAGLYPPAPDLRKSRTQELSDGEIFYMGHSLGGLMGSGFVPIETDLKAALLNATGGGLTNQLFINSSFS